MNKSLIKTGVISHEKALDLRNKSAWEQMKEITLHQAIDVFLKTLPDITKRAYDCSFRMLFKLQVINPDINLQQFSVINTNAIVDQIKMLNRWSEATKQARAAAFISFTGWLSRRSDGLIKKAVPNKEGTLKTFIKVREKVKTKAMNQYQWTLFLEALYKLNKRDCLIAKTALQGGKRISEVLKLKIEQINWADREIKFFQSKTKGTIKYTVITYPDYFMFELKKYIGSRGQGLVFITRNGKIIQQSHIRKQFEKAGINAKLPFKITPHVLRASLVTHLKQQGHDNSRIKPITGHVKDEQIDAYDKTNLKDNISKNYSII
jgi:integrase